MSGSYPRTGRSSVAPAAQIPRQPEQPILRGALGQVQNLLARPVDQIGRGAGRVFVRPGAPEQLPGPRHVRRGCRLAWLVQDRVETPPLPDRGPPGGMDDHERALALEDVRAGGAALVALHVEQVVANLEGDATETAELAQAFQVGVGPAADEAAPDGGHGEERNRLLAREL